MLENGYIRLYRSLLKWEWYDNVNTCRLFLHLLLTVNYEDVKWHGTVIKRGQRVCSLAKLSKETKLSVQSVRTAVSKLKSTGELTHRKTAEYGLFTIVNYEKYQDATQDVADEQHIYNTSSTDDQHQRKKAKKAKKEKEDYTCAFEQFWTLYPKKKSKGDAEKAWNSLSPSGELVAIILQKVAQATTCEDWTKDGGRYIPYPATWLRAKGWEDELEGAEQPQYAESEDSL